MTNRVVHCKKEPYDVYIGRPSKWGNPFSHKEGTTAQFKVATREEAVTRYQEWLLSQPDLLAQLPELAGKTLGCWCKPAACHGDVLVELAEFENLKDSITACTRCPLSCHRGSGNVQIVPGHGQPRSRIVLVGEAPGENEDLIGEPFVGLAGNMLDKIMAEAGIKREEVYITNTVKCRPTTKKGKKKSNRAPVDKEIQACKTWLYQELKLIQPKIVIPLGKVPTKLLLKIPKANFTMKDYLFKDHIVDYLNNFIVLPCWHPSYILRSPSTLMPEGVRVFKRAYDLMNNKYAELQG